jgi:hypothetical protein
LTCGGRRAPNASVGTTNGSETATAAMARARWPALGLAVTSVLSLVAMLASIAFSGWLLSSGRAGTGGLTSAEGVQVRIAWEMAIVMCNVVVLVGAVQMLQLRMRPLVLAACCIAIVPCCGPCLVLGIPFGVWGLVVLRDPEVRASFDRPT